MTEAEDQQLTKSIERAQMANQMAAGNTELPENIRLILQVACDCDGQFAQSPTVLAGCAVAATDLGLLREIRPSTGSGTIRWELTAEGRVALEKANAALGESASRYVVRLIKPLWAEESFAFGGPTLVPLSRSTIKHGEWLAIND